ncbi:MAG: type II toxin-antitoxin system HigA family antitoxin [Cyclobacteriaceae bacterium]|jgi:HTH-type transcriptional regulator/antitoxin HigA|nr:XRE family transcriptional regulator [Flammeovirgaceae bacterium]
MTWTVLHTPGDYKRALARLDHLAEQAPLPHSNEGRELELLGYLIQDFEDREWVKPDLDPIDAISVRMEQLHLNVADLLDVFGDRGTASKVLNRQRSLSLAMIRGLSERLTLPVDLLIRPTAPQSNKLAVADPRATYRKRRKR